MLIHLQPSQSSLKNRLIYLLEGTKNFQRPSSKVEILHGDVATFSLIHQSHSRKVKYFNLLITFKESKEELERKLAKHGKTLKDLHDEILSYLLPHDFDELNLLTVAHSDTDHYHWHITIDNLHLRIGKALYLPKTKLTIRLYDRLRRYVSAKYGISLGIPQPYGVEVGTKKLIEKLREKGKEGTTLKKEQVKQLITEQVKALILSGDINSRKDVEDYIEQVLGLEINRRGRSYISIRYGKTKIRLSGGIYDEQRFGQLAEEIRGGEEKDLYESPKRAGELEEELRELVERHRDLVRRRLRPTKRETQSDRQLNREQVERSQRGSEKGLAEINRGKEERLDSDFEKSVRGDAQCHQGGKRTESSRDEERFRELERGNCLSSTNQASIQANSKSFEINTPSIFPNGFGSWRSNRLDERKGTGREELSREIGRTGEDREELQAHQTGMAKEVGSNNYSNQQGRIPLFNVPNDVKKSKRGESTLVHNDSRRQSGEILYSVRPSPPAPHRTLIQKLYDEAVMEWELKRQEELEAIKRLSPEVIFQDLGIEAKRVGHRLCIYAPWREETKPSVFIEQKPNGHYVWKDFGSGKGGTWIDFFMEFYDWDYVEAVKNLRERYLGVDAELLNEVRRSSDNSFSFSSRKYELVELKAGEIKHPALKRYLRERGITKVPEWLKEVHYQLKDKETGEVRKYFALGVQTLSGSWILRNPMVKMNLRTADDQEHTFAYISRNGKRLVIVEGLFDALSIHQIARRGDFDLLILSGIGNVQKLLRNGILERYDEIFVATDRDEGGERAFKEIFAYLRDRQYLKRLYRIAFEDANDFNEAITTGRAIKLVDYTEELKRGLHMEKDSDIGPSLGM